MSNEPERAYFYDQDAINIKSVLGASVIFHFYKRLGSGCLEYLELSPKEIAESEYFRWVKYDSIKPFRDALNILVKRKYLSKDVQVGKMSSYRLTCKEPTGCKKSSFYHNDARNYGLREAIILQCMKYWIDKNKKGRETRNGKSDTFRDGRDWFYASYSQLSKMMPYFSIDTIRRAINPLIEKQVIIRSKFNKRKYDKTSWYTLGERYFNPSTLDSPECHRHISHLETFLDGRLTRSLAELASENREWAEKMLESESDSLDEIESLILNESKFQDISNSKPYKNLRRKLALVRLRLSMPDSDLFTIAP